jgi:hypothetical protein
MENNKRPGRDPLPRPQIERLDLPEEDHLAFWHLVIREFDWGDSRTQSLLLYRNAFALPYEEGQANG